MTGRAANGAGLGAGLVVLAAVCFGTLGVTSRFAFDAGVDPLTFVTWRAVIGGLAMVVIAMGMARRGQLVARPLAQIPNRQRLVAVGAGLANAVLNLAVFVALTRISVAMTLLVFYTYPALVALVATLFFGERLDAVRWGALGLSLVGLGLVIVGSGDLGQLDLLGVGLAFFAGVCQVIYAIAARHGFPSVPAPQAGVITLAVASLAYLGVSLASGQLALLTAPLASAAALVPVLWAGTIGAAIPTMAWILGIRILGAPRAAIISTLEPVVAVTLAALLLSEVPTLVQVIGGVCIVAAAIIVQGRRGGEAADHEAVADALVADARP